jgi:hypothetical protein
MSSFVAVWVARWEQRAESREERTGTRDQGTEGKQQRSESREQRMGEGVLGWAVRDPSTNIIRDYLAPFKR